jgi:ABC-type dipeptide/oligopeptide/nickel transport system permease component
VRREEVGEVREGMGALLSNAIGILVVLALIGFLVFTGFRLGPRFLVRRLAGLVFVLLGVTFITFIMGYFAPGNAVYQQLGQHYTKPQYDALIHAYGLDLPWYQQYANYVIRLLHFDLGRSFINDSQSVWDILRLYVPASIQLGFAGVITALILGIPTGILAAVRSSSRTDTSLQSVALVLYALPTFVLIPFYQLLMVHLYIAGLPSLPVSGWDNLSEQIGPILIFGAGAFAYYLRLTRASMLEVLHQDYIRTARAKGLRENVVVWRHAFRNAIIPLITAVGPALAFAVAGLFVVERLFNIPGIGNQALASVFQRDWPVVQGTTILLALAVVFMNLVTDVAYGFADPRIRSE